LKFHINNVEFKIEFSFLLLIALSYFLQNKNVIYVILFSALHEIGHIIMLYILGGKAQKITIAYYGIGLVHKSRFNDFKQILFLLSGVSVNLIFALLNIKRNINLALFLVNILPLYPLDGGRAFKLILNNIFGIIISDKIFITFSIIIILLLIIVSIYLKNLSLVLIVIYIIIYSINNSFE
jgi:stage IV sporulation protein FB